MDDEIFDGQDPVKLYVPKQERREKFTIDACALIGVSDSDIGGLTAIRELMCQIPDERMVHFGDTARLPYSAKSRGTIIRFSCQVVRFLKAKGVKAIVIACNTANSHASETPAEENETPAIGVIYAGALSAVRITKSGRISVIGTRGTVNSEIYPKVIQSISPDICVFQKTYLMFAPLVEKGLLHDSVTDETMACYLQELKEKYVDILVLGCIHYPLLRSTIGRVMGEEATLVNPAYEIAMEFRDIFAREKLLNPGDGNMEGKHRFYVSDLAENFRNFTNSILSTEHLEVKKIEIEEYRREGES